MDTTINREITIRKGSLLHYLLHQYGKGVPTNSCHLLTSTVLALIFVLFIPFLGGIICGLTIEPIVAWAAACIVQSQMIMPEGNVWAMFGVVIIIFGAYLWSGFLRSLVERRERIQAGLSAESSTETAIRQTWRAVHDKVCLPVRVVE